MIARSIQRGVKENYMIKNRLIVIISPGETMLDIIYNGLAYLHHSPFIMFRWCIFTESRKNTALNSSSATDAAAMGSTLLPPIPAWNKSTR